MSLFCKECNSRRLPERHESEKETFWLCKKCENFVNTENVIIREQTDEERQDVKRKHDEFEKSINFSKEKMVRRKGVN